MPPTPNKMWEDKDKQNTANDFILFLLILFSEIHEPMKKSIEFEFS